MSDFRQDPGAFRSVADLRRHIGLDERQHEGESVVRMAQRRFR